MAQLHLVALSEATGNDIEAQQWLLQQVCNRVQSLGKVSLTTTNSTYDDLSTLITTLCHLYAATGCDFHSINRMLEAKLEETLAQYDPADIKEAEKVWAERKHEFWHQMLDLEIERGDELEKRSLRYFFKPRRG